MFLRCFRCNVTIHTIMKVGTVASWHIGTTSSFECDRKILYPIIFRYYQKTQQICTQAEPNILFCILVYGESMFASNCRTDIVIFMETFLQRFSQTVHSLFFFKWFFWTLFYFSHRKQALLLRSDPISQLWTLFFPFYTMHNTVLDFKI